MIIGITGGTGFIGKYLALRHVEEGDSVRILSRRSGHNQDLPKSITYFRGDLTKGVNADLIKFADGVDVLYHCAAEIRDQSKMDSVNVSGTKNLCEAARDKTGHFVLLSSVGVYGFRPEGIISEETPLNPAGLYEKSKAESEKIVISASKEGDFSYSILRPSNVYGPRMNNQSLFQMVSMINRGYFFFIGKPGSVMNYIHVDNIVYGLLLCGKLNQAKEKIYNLSDHRSIEKFVSIISQSLKKPLPELRLPVQPVRYIAKLCEYFPGSPLTESRIAHLTGRAVYSTEKIAGELGYSHSVSMEDGIRQLTEFWKQNILIRK